MKILHCISSLSGGGAERQIAYISEAQSLMGHDVTIAYLYDGPSPPCFEGTQVRLHRLVARFNSDPALLLQLRSLMQSLRPDIVTTWILQMDVVAGLAATSLSIPWLLREPSSSWDWLPLSKRALRTFVGRHASAIVANSRGGQNYWKKQAPDIPSYLVLNALPTDRIRATQPIRRADLGLPSDGKLILFAGRFSPEKNLENTLKVLINISETHSICALLCGSGPQYDWARALIRTHGLSSRIVLPGFVSNVWACMKAADIFVNLSYFEGQPNTVLEAMACGVPLLLSDIPSHRDLLDHTTARLVNPSSPQEIEQGLLSILSNEDEAKLRARAAEKLISQFSIEQSSRALLSLYDTVLSNRTRS